MVPRVTPFPESTTAKFVWMIWLIAATLRTATLPTIVREQLERPFGRPNALDALVGRFKPSSDLRSMLEW